MPIWHLCVRDVWESGANDPKNDGGRDFLPPASDSTTKFSLVRCEVEQADQFPLIFPFIIQGEENHGRKCFLKKFNPKKQLQWVNKPTIFQSHGLFSPYFEAIWCHLFSFCLEMVTRCQVFVPRKGATTLSGSTPPGVSDVIRTCNQTMKHLENCQQRKNVPPTRGH